MDSENSHAARVVMVEKSSGPRSDPEKTFSLLAKEPRVVTVRKPLWACLVLVPKLYVMGFSAILRPQ